MTPPKLKARVILGYTDINAAGSRTLLGIDIDKFSTSPLHLQSLSDSTSQRASINHAVSGLKAAVLLCEHKTKDVSLIIINTILAPWQAHVVANEIIDFVSSGNVKEFIILSAFAIGSSSALMKITNKDENSDASRRLRCADPFLNSLLQFSKVERFATSLIAVDGRRAQKGKKANSSDGSQQAIEALLQYLRGELQLEMSADRSFSWVLSEDVSNSSEDSLMFI